MFRSILLVAALWAGSVAADTWLLMLDQAGCSWCAAWTAEVGPEYAKTQEGRIAPLIRQDIASALPDGVELSSPPVFTPTFVLLHDGTEIGRIEGYPGEDFFWGLLGMMIEKLPEAAREEPDA
jgi:hypothetical protein